jgi:hypothetical protein
MDKKLFRNELERLINCHSVENGSNTPDFMLADYLMRCLENYEQTIDAREKWYGRPNESPATCSPSLVGPGPATLSPTT